MNKYSDKYQHLSPVQKQFIDEKTVSTTMRISKWLSLLVKVSKFDQRNDKIIKRLLVWAIVSFLLAFFSFVSFAVIKENAFYFIALFAVTGVTLLILRGKKKRKDVNNYLRMFFLPILTVLEAKCGSDAKLAATLDFRIPRKAMAPEKSKVGVKKLKLYSPKYIVARVTMKDQAVLEFVVADDIKDFSWKKRSRSGKTKYKRKTKFVHQCLIKMSLPKSEYRYKGSRNRTVSVVEVNEHYQAKAKIKIKAVGQDKMLGVNVFFETMQKIYANFEPINPVGQTTPQKPKGKGRKEVYEEDPGLALDTPYIWYGSAFSTYDYDSFEYSDSGDTLMEDDSVNAFDS
ncbi:hypothetical protein JMN32_24010 [Fulvivirga sp. 29W222]|uniref:Uncharacterized protein n=1 Tax=Fulvivirga marina TaxID=2494733 RepID=A0A937G2R9_9BACT|nr:hypothetical protein [Fulvivirga marina]MBL6449398.1 hypothetical protein [Fulvivirga marina]